MGMSSGWERFDFNKDAPLDDDDEETEGEFFFHILDVIFCFCGFVDYLAFSSELL